MFGTAFPDCVIDLREGIDIKEFAKQPFAMNPVGSAFRGGMDNFLMEEGVALNAAFENGNHELQLELCAAGLAISFCTQMHLYMVRKINEKASPDERIYVFPVKRLAMRNRMYLIKHADAYFPRYKERMQEISSEVVRRFELLDSDDFMEFNL